LEPEKAEALLLAEPKGNVHADQAATFLQRVVADFEALRPMLNATAQERGAALLEAHRRVRSASRQQDVSYRVEPQLPPDVLGIYVYLPVAT
jgi:outer membrane murein-binding lipoprotein Lpp